MFGNEVNKTNGEQFQKKKKKKTMMVTHPSLLRQRTHAFKHLSSSRISNRLQGHFLKVCLLL